jgi:hypothetical protein
MEKEKMKDEVKETREEYKPEEKSEKEKRVRALTKIYYSNPKIQEALLKFGQEREVVPRYFEGFGKRPDIIQYPPDIMGLVNKGATSFHCSEEIWQDPLKISSEMQLDELGEIRKSWDLLIDIDSPYFDVSREAAKLVVELFEKYGIKNYGIKFSGSKGLHIIVSGKAFPEEYEGEKMKYSFPKWPRAITEYMFQQILPEFRRRVGKIMSFSSLDDKNDKGIKVACKNCHKIALKGDLTKLKCPVCNLDIERRDYKLTKRRLRCLGKNCPGVLEIMDSQDYYKCESCKDPENEKLPLSSNKYPESFEEVEAVDEHAELDLVLVASRHLFRMPYSLHEKTALASVVLRREELDNFTLRDASPLNVEIREFYPENTENEAKKLLVDALNWKKNKQTEDEKLQMEKYKGEKAKYENLEIKGATEEMFPPAINKLLKGLNDGKKRGLFILITFLKTLNFTPEYINNKVREWNKLNNPPLKEGYVKSQLDWHLRQRKKILPPNYDNESFYKDLGLIDRKQETKNPIVDVVRKLRRG